MAALLDIGIRCSAHSLDERSVRHVFIPSADHQLLLFPSLCMHLFFFLSLFFFLLLSFFPFPGLSHSLRHSLTTHSLSFPLLFSLAIIFSSRLHLHLHLVLSFLLALSYLFSLSSCAATCVRSFIERLALTFVSTFFFFVRRQIVTFQSSP